MRKFFCPGVLALTVAVWPTSLVAAPQGSPLSSARTVAAGQAQPVPGRGQAPPAAQAQQQAPPQTPPGGVRVCNQTVAPPSQLPPAGSGPVLWLAVACFPTQGNVSVVDAQTYRYYMQIPLSRPSQGAWTPWDDKTEAIVLADFKRLWNTHFLDNLWIDVEDYPFANGVVGKIVTYNMEERPRVKIVDYLGSKELDQTKIEDKLKEENVSIRLDSFVDEAVIRKVQGIVKEMLAEKGYQDATVTHSMTEMPGGPKLVHLSFNIDEGPKIKIRAIDFVGNQAIGDFWLKRQMKNNKGQWLFSFITGRGTYQETKFEEDADRVLEYYRNKGYVGARIGEPELKALEDSTDMKTRYVQMRIPVQEGPRYKVGEFTFDGNKVVKTEALRALFKLKAGDWYNEKKIRKGLEKARELYGAVGYFEFTGYPDLQPREATQPAAGQSPGDAGAGPQEGEPPQAPAAGQAAARPVGPSKAPLVDVIMRLQEGTQYFVNRITFVGNTTTRDNVVRREMRLVEGGVFNTEALKYSIKRINQLGYFKNIEGQKEIEVEKTPDTANKVDVTLKVEEQNRNQLTFGAGVSQYEGFFGQLGFQTANFMGRGETFSVNLQAGSRAQNYQVGFTEPFLFDRAITAGTSVYKSEVRWINQFTQSSIGGNIVFGFPLKDFTRLFVQYGYEKTRVKDLNPAYLDPLVLQNNPYLQDSLLINQGGYRTVSKIVPSLVHNTIDNPIFPTTGRRYTLSVDLAGLGGDTNFYKPSVEGVWYLKQTNRTSFGFRAQAEYIAEFAGSKPLPIFEKLFLGGEYSIRGFDIRTIGPKSKPVPVQLPGIFVPGAYDVNATSEPIVVGGNKSVLFNAEYLISIAGPVRLVLFADAGQVRDQGERFRMSEFKTSTGAEIRFFMPVLNVPFRLIFAYNPSRSGVLDNNFQPQKAFSFRFAVGSTF